MRIAVMEALHMVRVIRPERSCEDLEKRAYDSRILELQ